MTTTVARQPKDSPQTYALARITPLMEARALQRFLYDRASRKDVTDGNLAVLARSWALVQDCIRVMRGIPDPGSLRPDLDPLQLMKAIKRSKGRKPIELGSGGGFAGPAEDSVADLPAAVEMVQAKSAKVAKPVSEPIAEPGAAEPTDAPMSPPTD